MKELAKYSGIIVLIVGVIILYVSVSGGKNSNTGLILSAFLVILGFLGYILLNRYME